MYTIDIQYQPLTKTFKLDGVEYYFKGAAHSVKLHRADNQRQIATFEPDARGTFLMYATLERPRITDADMRVLIEAWQKHGRPVRP